MAGTVAAYVLILQLGQIDLATLISQADWRWAGLAVLLSAATYVGAAMSVEGICSRTLELLAHHPGSIGGGFRDSCLAPRRWAQWASTFAISSDLVHPALAAASIGVSQVMAFGMHILLVLGFGPSQELRRKSTSHRRAGRSSLESHSSLGWSCSSFCRSLDTGQNDAFVQSSAKSGRDF